MYNLLDPTILNHNHNHITNPFSVCHSYPPRYNYQEFRKDIEILVECKQLNDEIAASRARIQQRINAAKLMRTDGIVNHNTQLSISIPTPRMPQQISLPDQNTKHY